MWSTGRSVSVFHRTVCPIGWWVNNILSLCFTEQSVSAAGECPPLCLFVLQDALSQELMSICVFNRTVCLRGWWVYNSVSCVLRDSLFQGMVSVHNSVPVFHRTVCPRGRRVYTILHLCFTEQSVPGAVECTPFCLCVSQDSLSQGLLSVHHSVSVFHTTVCPSGC